MTDQYATCFVQPNHNQNYHQVKMWTDHCDTLEKALKVRDEALKLFKDGAVDCAMTGKVSVNDKGVTAITIEETLWINQVENAKDTR